MRRQHRILHLITRLDLGGAQQNTLFSVAHHDRSRFDVHLVAGGGGQLDDEAKRIPDATVDLLDSIAHPIAPARDLFALLRLRALFRKQRIDLVHTHSSKAGLLGRCAAFLAGVPVVVHTVHGWSFNDTQPAWKRRFYVALERAAAGVTTHFVVVSSRDRERGLALRIGRPDRYSVVRSGIEIDRFATPAAPRERTRADLGFGPEDVVVGTLACLKPQKAPLDFVRAAEAAHEKVPALRFFIAGDGELRGPVEALIRERGLDGVVRVLGWRRDVTDLLHAMDIFLLTSRFEGLPRSVLQAMAAGVPVVATAVDGTPEVVADGETGLLVPPAEPEAAARAVARMASDPALRDRCRAAALRRLGREFDVGEMVRDLDRLYLGMLDGR